MKRAGRAKNCRDAGTLDLCNTRRREEAAPALPGYIRSIIALPNPEQLTWVEPGIRRAKS